jgi:hypothetical protein
MKSYDKIDDLIYADIDEAKIESRIVELLAPEWRLAYRILELLQDRKGFSDWWFDEIPASCRTEIFYAIANLISDKTGIGAYEKSED